MKKFIFALLEVLANSWRKFILSRLLLAGFALVCVLGGLSLSSPVLALTVSPVRMELAGDPGTAIKSNLLLINEKEKAEIFYSSLENFEATGETGTPTFVPAKEGEEGLVSWIEITSKVTIEPGEQKEVPCVINIPEDADPGGHFAAVFWSASSPESKDGGVSISTKVGILVLLKVTGDIEEGGGILEFSTENEQKLFNSLPVNFEFRFQNSGNDRIKPEGELTIKNIFGKVSAVLPANEVEGNVLPQSIRKFEVIWEKIQEDEEVEKTDTTEEDTEKKGFFEELKNEKDNFAFGRYTAELDLEYGEEKSQASFSFFIIPWRILTLTIVFLILAILIATKGLKKYNKWVIAKAQKG